MPCTSRRRFIGAVIAFLPPCIATPPGECEYAPYHAARMAYTAIYGGASRYAIAGKQSGSLIPLFPHFSHHSPLEGEKRRLRFPCPLGGRRRRYAPHRRDFGLRPRLADSPSRGE
ncbi:MAG: hypothetical protein OXU61_12810 [Gammaproteobacteria bacterium]|nr:hypothetical protein [Gammaproteobacteria bacterium]